MNEHGVGAVGFDREVLHHANRSVPAHHLYGSDAAAAAVWAFDMSDIVRGR